MKNKNIKELSIEEAKKLNTKKLRVPKKEKKAKENYNICAKTENDNVVLIASVNKIDLF